MKKHYETSELLTMSDRTLNKSSDMSIKREEGVRRGVYLGLFLLFSAPIRIFIYASGNPYFNEVTFARFQPPSQSQNKYLISYLEINRDRRLVV